MVTQGGLIIWSFFSCDWPSFSDCNFTTNFIFSYNRCNFLKKQEGTITWSLTHTGKGIYEVHQTCLHFSSHLLRNYVCCFSCMHLLHKINLPFYPQGCDGRYPYHGAPSALWREQCNIALRHLPIVLFAALFSQFFLVECFYFISCNRMYLFLSLHTALRTLSKQTAKINFLACNISVRISKKALLASSKCAASFTFIAT